MNAPADLFSAPGILVAYDGSADSDNAARWAGETAASSGETVTALIVVDPVDMPRGRPWPEQWWQEMEGRARARLTDAGASAVRVERRKGPTTATLVEAAQSASALVIGSRGHSRVGEFLLNSVSQSAARQARCPVVVVRAPKDGASRRVVVGVDGSEPSLRALGYACRHAALAHDPVSVVRAWKPGTVPVDLHGEVPTSLSTSVAHEEAILDDIVTRSRAAHPTITIEADFMATGPGNALVDVSAHAHLVVVGAQGMTALQEAVLGSVSQHVLRHAHCTVAVVH